MALPIIALATGIIDKAVDHFWPDATEQEKLKLEKIKVQIALDLGQQEINRTEAAHPSVFVAGWRPFLGWAGGLALVYATIGRSLIAWLSTINGWEPPPDVDVGELVAVVMTLLGSASLRTYEGTKGIKRSSWSSPANDFDGAG